VVINSRFCFRIVPVIFCLVSHLVFAAHEPDLTSADQLYRAGKFADAEAAYEQIIQSSPDTVAAQVGMVRSMLKQQKVDEALEKVNAAVTASPNSAALMATKGEVLFRLGEMADAERAYLQAVKIDPKEVQARLGLAHLYNSYSLFGRAYGELQLAHEIAPDDIDVRRAWLGRLPRKERLAALEAYLASPHPDDQEDTKHLEEYLEFLKATADAPIHRCRLVSKVDHTDTKLEGMYHDAQQLRGIGLAVSLNGHNNRLLLDTGAGGIIISRKVAEKADLKRISAAHYGGIGDEGLQEGYTAVANKIRIGELEFEDCVVHVSEQRSVAEEDGLIGADVLGSYLVELDLPDMRLKLSPLPKRPDDVTAPKALNSEGESQSTAEEVKSTAAEAGTDKKDDETGPQVPRDRYIAPEMATWTKVFRFGHMLLVPTNVNESKAMLFGLDTGAFANLLSTRSGKQVSRLSADDAIRVKGASGQVAKVYRSGNVTLQFGHMRQPAQNMVSIDLSGLSGHVGTEVSGFLGFTMLHMLDVKLDYRDGLVDFECGPPYCTKGR
jgi:tetratricopeptide (TPR) repeat protein